jgi:hypothetical protein
MNFNLDTSEMVCIYLKNKFWGQWHEGFVKIKRGLHVKEFENHWYKPSLRVFRRVGNLTKNKSLENNVLDFRGMLETGSSNFLMMTSWYASLPNDDAQSEMFWAEIEIPNLDNPTAYSVSPCIGELSLQTMSRLPVSQSVHSSGNFR